MDVFLNGHFYSPSQGNLVLDEVIGEIIRYIGKKKEKFYEIIVGCDSSSGTDPNFPVAVVVLRKGEGGRFFLKKISYQDRKFYSWKERVLQEVLLSCEMALLLKERLETKMGDLPLLPNYQFRYIHADVGEHGATKDMIKEVVGLIRGNGFEPKIKPEAYVASVIADRYS